MKINKYLYGKAFDKALKVEFLTSCEELFLYVGALYSAMMWGQDIDKKNNGYTHTEKPFAKIAKGITQ